MNNNPACFIINDFSRLNETCVSMIAAPQSLSNIQQALALARAKKWKVSIGGARHSMGGQSIAPGGLSLDMTKFNQILEVDRIKKTIRVQSGVTWKQIQSKIDQLGLSVRVMQNYNFFTVGGSVSVNAIGWNTNESTIASSIKSMRILTPGGEVLNLSPKENSQLFSLVIGGYGLFGIIIDVELHLTNNILYTS
jgi:decaprenylphospho-beta-D-ribofuranose 2-oxidase